MVNRNVIDVVKNCMAKDKKNKLVNKKEEKPENVTFESSKILLDVMREEYAKERERCASLENKAGMFIATVIAIITVFIPMAPFEKITGSYGSDVLHIIFVTLLLCVFIYAFGNLIYAFYWLFQVINLKEYSRPNLLSVKDKEIQLQPEEITANGLLDHFYTIIDLNIKVNDKKVDNLKKGLTASIVGFILLAISTIGLKIIL